MSGVAVTAAEREDRCPECGRTTYIGCGAAWHDRVPHGAPTHRLVGADVELFARAPRLGWDSWGRGYEIGAAS